MSKAIDKSIPAGCIVCGGAVVKVRGKAGEGHRTRLCESHRKWAKELQNYPVNPLKAMLQHDKDRARLIELIIAGNEL